MKRILILTLALCSLAFAGGWDATTNMSGLGLTTIDSLSLRYGGRIGSGYPLKFGLVNVKDTLVARVKIPSLLSDTFTISGTNCQMYFRDAGTANMVGGGWFYTGSIQAYGGIDGVSNTGSVTGMNNGTFAGLVTGARFKSTAGPDTSVRLVVTNQVKSTTDSTTNLVSTRVKADTVVIRDSLMITPEGGMATLMKNGSGNKLYKGNIVAAYPSIGRKTFSVGSGMPSNAIGVIYSDSIANGAWGWVVTYGYCLVAVQNVPTVSAGEFAIGVASQAYIDINNVNEANWCEGMMADTLRYGINHTAGDSLRFMFFQKTGYAPSP